MKKNHVLLLVCSLVVVLILYLLAAYNGLLPGSLFQTDNERSDDVSENDPEDYDDEGENEGENEGELSIYTIDYNTFECTPSVILVPKDIKPDEEYIVKEVVANFREDANVIDIEKKDSGIYVYFAHDKAPVTGVSDKMENAMLNCIAYSLLDNIKSCDSIYFRTDKGEYTGDNITLDYDEPYVSR